MAALTSQTGAAPAEPLATTLNCTAAAGWNTIESPHPTHNGLSAFVKNFSSLRVN